MNPDEDKLVEVFQASSEMEALTIQSFLKSSGIPAAVKSRQIPMFDGLAKVYNPVWGHVVVLAEKELEASDLIAGYLDSLEENADSLTEDEVEQ